MTRPVLTLLAPLFAVQFLCWSAMFLLWIGAYPVIVLGVLGLGTMAARDGVLAVAGCFAWYATAAAMLAFAIPAGLRRAGAPVLLGLGALVGAGGLAGLAAASGTGGLIASFTAIAVGWCALSNLPYTIAARLVGEGRIDHGLRLFAFSTILPQLAVFALLAWRLGALDAASARLLMRLAAGAMAAGGVLALALRRRL